MLTYRGYWLWVASHDQRDEVIASVESLGDAARRVLENFSGTSEFVRASVPPHLPERVSNIGRALTVEEVALALVGGDEVEDGANAILVRAGVRLDKPVVAAVTVRDIGLPTGPDSSLLVAAEAETLAALHCTPAIHADQVQFVPTHHVMVPDDPGARLFAFRQVPVHEVAGRHFDHLARATQEVDSVREPVVVDGDPDLFPLFFEQLSHLVPFFGGAFVVLTLNLGVMHRANDASECHSERQTVDCRGDPAVDEESSESHQDGGHQILLVARWHERPAPHPVVREWPHPDDHHGYEYDGGLNRVLGHRFYQPFPAFSRRTRQLKHCFLPCFRQAEMSNFIARAK